MINHDIQPTLLYYYYHPVWNYINFGFSHCFYYIKNLEKGSSGMNITERNYCFITLFNTWRIDDWKNCFTLLHTIIISKYVSVIINLMIQWIRIHKCVHRDLRYSSKKLQVLNYHLVMSTSLNYLLLDLLTLYLTNFTRYSTSWNSYRETSLYQFIVDRPCVIYSIYFWHYVTVDMLRLFLSLNH